MIPDEYISEGSVPTRIYNFGDIELGIQNVVGRPSSSSSSSEEGHKGSSHSHSHKHHGHHGGILGAIAKGAKKAISSSKSGHSSSNHKHG